MKQCFPQNNMLAIGFTNIKKPRTMTAQTF